MPGRSRRVQATTAAPPAAGARPRLALIIGLIALVPIAGYYWFTFSKNSIEERQRFQLQAIAADKAREVSNWRSARINDAARLAKAIETLVADDPANLRDPPATITGLLHNTVGGPRFIGAYLADADGVLRATAGVAPSSRLRLIQHVLITKDPDIAFGKADTVWFDVAAPLLTSSGQMLGVVVLRIDPHLELYPALLSRPLVSETTEVLLVQQRENDVVFLSPLRFRERGEGIALPLSTNALAAALAVTGMHGFVTAVDYRNVAVTAALHPILGSSWAIVAKIDHEEELAAVRDLALRSALASLLMMLVAALIAGLWWRHHRLAHRLQVAELARERLALERHYDYLAKYANDIILLADPEGRIIEANDRAVEAYGYPRERLLGMRWGDLTEPGSLPEFAEHWDQVVEQDAMIFEIRQLRADGRIFPAEVSARIIEVDHKSFYQAIVRDISERKLAEAKITRLTQLYAVMTHTNAAIMRTGTRERLLFDVCHIAVSEGPFGAAWIAEVDREHNLLRRVVSCGERSGPDELRLPLDTADPINAAIDDALSENTVGIADAVPDEIAARWSGVRSLAVLPLHCEAQVVGLLAVCAGEPGFLDPQLRNLLEELSRDISFAITHIESESRRRQVEASLRDTERRYRQLFEQTSSGVAVYEPRNGGEDFVIKDINPTVERVEHVRREDVIGKSILDVFPGVRDFGLFDVMQRVFRTGQGEHHPPTYYEDAERKGWRDNEVYRLPSGEVVCVYDDVTEKVESERALRENERRLALAIEGSSDGFWDWSIPKDQVYFSDRYAGILGFRREEIEPSPRAWQALIHPDDYPATLAAIAAHERNLTPRFEIEHRMLTKTGEWRWILARGKIVERDANGNPVRVAGAITDITERRAAEDQRRLWAKVFENSQDAIIITDDKRAVIAVNAAFVATLGYSAADVEGKRPAFLESTTASLESEAFWDTVALRGAWEGEAAGRQKDGSEVPLWMSITVVRGATGAVVNYILIFSDITERKTAEERIRYLSHHDILTGLPNRALFHERVARALARAAETNERLAMLLLDLDRFKSVNDRFGGNMAGEVLRTIARRITEAVDINDTVGRHGGDQFAVLLPTIATPADPAHVAESLLAAVAQPIRIGDQDLLLSCSIGISVFPEDGGDYESLKKNAEAALRYAKELGRGNYQFFAPQLNTQASEWLALENDLRWAVERGELFLAYQPQYDLGGTRLVGIEALVRWRHPQRGVIPPGRFMPLAEESGLVIRIGEWVLKEACRQRHQWVLAGLQDIPVAVNISAVQFAQRDFEQVVTAALLESGLPPGLLELEVTETVIMRNPEETARTLKRLKTMGISIAIDDFGTGYSSLSYLQRFPLDRLKIDRSFVTSMPSEAANRVVTESVIGLGKNLGLRVIAEGVETEGELSILRMFDCDEVQGFYFSRPLSSDEFQRAILRSR
ncbi:MAG: EAL domain-containing protein [Thiohalomonadaceae bacterium]